VSDAARRMGSRGIRIDNKRNSFRYVVENGGFPKNRSSRFLYCPGEHGKSPISR
jgi:hypothetical protein